MQNKVLAAEPPNDPRSRKENGERDFILHVPTIAPATQAKRATTNHTINVQTKTPMKFVQHSPREAKSRYGSIP